MEGVVWIFISSYRPDVTFVWMGSHFPCRDLVTNVVHL
jgi:hypothetical protein